MNDMRGPDGETGERLREVLAGAAGSVDPADGSLGRVLDRAHRRTRWSWSSPALAAAAALVVVAGIITVVAVNRPTGSAPSTSGPPVSGSTTQSPSPSVTASGAPVALPVYYAGVSGGEARLYREFHRVVTSQPAADAVRQSIGVAPLDPDYRSLWPAGTTLVSYDRSGAVADVVLSAAPEGYLPVALQQIVHTVTAADPTVTSVRIAYGTTTGEPLARADADTVLPSVWLLSPTEGATTGSPVTLGGTASVFEATVSWEVDRTDGSKVAEGSAMASIGAPGRGPWSTTVSLPPGDYVAQAFEVSMKDGSRHWVDTKSFTVR